VVVEADGLVVDPDRLVGEPDSVVASAFRLMVDPCADRARGDGVVACPERDGVDADTVVEKDDGLVADPAGTEHGSVVAKLMRGPLGRHHEHRGSARMRGRASMIARQWHGRVRAADADAYYAYLLNTGLLDYRRTAGNRGVQVLRRREGDVVHYLLTTLWDSWASIQAFAGEDVARARYYPEDTRYLLELEPTVTHFEVLEVVSDEPAH
jgi:heme-degrading monooxygenase HmoA